MIRALTGNTNENVNDLHSARHDAVSHKVSSIFPTSLWIDMIVIIPIWQLKKLLRLREV